MLHSRIQRIGRSDIWSFSNVFYICVWSMVIDMANYKTFARFWNTFNHCMKKAMNRITFIWEILFSFLSEKITPCSHVIGIKISRILFNSFFYLHGNHVINAIMIYLCMGLTWPAFSQIKCNLDTFQILHSWYISYNFLISKTKKQCNMHEGCVTQETHANTFSDRKRMISW